MLLIIPGIIISYLVGSIPTAYIFGRLLRGIDIRKFGSGNVGATNALRVLGKGPGIIVLALDIIKGFLPVILLGNFIYPRSGMKTDMVFVILGIACIIGHNWTLFLGFKGGKGIATTLGVLIALAVKIPGLENVLALTIFTWLLIFLISRIVSLSSIAAALALPLYLILFKQSIQMLVSGIILTAFVILRHKSNLTRIFQGKESKLIFK
jgi:glycerol-3-phosphate acyltransferase PlsY